MRTKPVVFPKKMNRDGPGFLIDLFYLWIVVIACLVVADTLDRQIEGPVGLLLGIAASILIVCLFLLAYYRVYLDERPLLGSASRTRFAVLVFQIVLVGFVIGALFSPPNPATQVAVAAVIVIGGVLLSYWWVYRRNEQSARGVV